MNTKNLLCLLARYISAVLLCMGLYNISPAVTYEAENQSPSGTGASSQIVTDTAASNDEWVLLNGNNVGDYLSITINNVQAGDYTISYGYKVHSVRGQVQLSVNGFNIGGQINQSSGSNNEYKVANLGSFTFGTTGNKTLQFETKAAGNSGGYKISVDWIKFESSGGGTGVFIDEGIIGNTQAYMEPCIISTGGENLLIAAQRRYTTTVSGGHWEKGAADIVTWRSTNAGDSWTYQGKTIYDSGGASGDCGYGPVLIRDGSKVACIYSIGPQNWNESQLDVHIKISTNGGSTWPSGNGTDITVSGNPSYGKPTNGGQGYVHTNGRWIIPGRECLLYSDNDGVSWSATPEFTSHVETKCQPYFISGAMSKTALVPYRTQNVSQGKYKKIRISDFYSDNGTTTTTYGANNNFGFVRYDNNTLLMTRTTSSNQLEIARSTDEGATWGNIKNITASAPNARYSEVAVTANGMIVVVYMENNTSAANGGKLRVVRFDMDWLLN